MRICVLVDRARLSVWHTWLHADLAAAGHNAFISSAEDAAGWPSTLEIALRLDRLLHRKPGEHGIDRAGDLCPETDMEQEPIDVLINCSGHSSGLPAAARVLTPLFDGRPTELGAIAAFLDHRQIVIGIADNRAPGAPRSARPAIADRLSMTATLDSVLSRAVELIIDVVDRPAARGSTSVIDACTSSGSRPAAAADRTVPVVASYRHLAYVVSTKLAHRLLQTVRSPERWAIAIGQCAGPGLIEGAWPAKSSYKLVRDDGKRFYADPILFERGGRTWLFCEEFPFETERGILAVAEVAPDGNVGPMRPVLERPYHLSYPFVFEDGGQIWMIPETQQNRTVELYRAVEFPHRWEHERNLIEGLSACDATLLRRDGVYSLLLTASHRLSTSWDSLRIFESQSLAGPFMPHATRLAAVDARHSRSGGALLWRGADLLRPTQDCMRLYGGGLVLTRVDRLTRDDFVQTEVAEIGVCKPAAITGTHTYSKSSSFEAVDAWGPVDGVDEIVLELRPLPAARPSRASSRESKSAGATPTDIARDDRPVAIDHGEPGLVSVVIPTFNRGYILDRAISSALAQSYAKIEVIVVDDGSTDDTAAVVGRFGDAVRVIRQPNGGVCAARNAGLRIARGEFIALLDSDDAWLPWKLDVQVAVLEAFPGVGMVWTDMIGVDERGAVLSHAYLRQFYSAHKAIRIEDIMHRVGSVADALPSASRDIGDRSLLVGDIFSHMMLGNLVHTSSVLMRRDRLRSVGLFDPQLRCSGEDYEFHVRTTFYGPVAFIDLSSILYRVGSIDQLTNSRYNADIARNNLTTVQRWIERGRERIDLPTRLVQERLAGSHAWLGESELELGHNAAAAHHLARSLLLAPRLRSAQQLALCILPRFAREVIRQIKRAMFGLLRPSGHNR
jgi:glycosyltransferase involved in cell wall biosynthesis